MRPILTLALLAPAFAATQSPGERFQLAYRPAAESSQQKSFSLDMELELSGASSSTNGDEALSPSIQAQTRYSRSFHASEEILQVGAQGEPTRIRRSYGDAQFEVACPVEVGVLDEVLRANVHASSGSPWDGAAMELTRDGQSWSAKPFGSDSEELRGLIPKMNLDLSMAGLLPKRSVTLDQTWRVSPRAFLEVFVAGGDMGFELVLDGDDPPLGAGDPTQVPPLEDWFEDLGESRVTARLVKVHQTSNPLAEVHLDVRMEGSADVSEHIADGLLEALPSGVEDPSTVAVMDTLLDGNAVLLWDLRKNQVHSLDFRGNIATSYLRIMQVELATGVLTMESTWDSEGEVRCQVMEAPLGR